MAFLSSMRVRKYGAAKILWMPKEWNIRKGDVMCMEARIKGQTLYHTTTARENSSRYLIVPRWWDVEIGDVIDIKITYANVPKREPGTVNELPPEEPASQERENADTGAEDKESD